MELGANDAYLILKDADLEKAAEAYNVYDEFKSLMIEKAQAYQMGGPLKKETVLGLLSRSDLRDIVHEQVRESIDKGALLEMGGEIPESKGFYYTYPAFRRSGRTTRL